MKYAFIVACIAGGNLQQWPDIFVLRWLASFIGSCRDILYKVVELPRNIKQAFLLILDMAPESHRWARLHHGL